MSMGSLRRGARELGLEVRWRFAFVGHGAPLQPIQDAESAARTAGKAIDQRPSSPRFDDGATRSGDPWYDGRGHSYTIVDAPHAGTVLSYDSIQSIVEAPSWKVPASAIRRCRSPSTGWTSSRSRWASVGLSGSCTGSGWPGWRR